MRDLLVDGRRQEPERLDARRLRAERRIGLVGREHRVHLAGHFAEPQEAREEPLRLLGELVERELPAVEPAAHVLLQDPQRRRERAAGVRVPAAERRDVREAVLGEEAQNLELRVDAGLEPAEDLEDQLFVEDDRRVRLLRADVARVEQLLAEGGEACDGPKLDGALVPLQREPRADRADELACNAEALLLGREQLIDVVRARVVPQLRERERVARLR